MEGLRRSRDKIEVYALPAEQAAALLTGLRLQLQLEPPALGPEFR